MREENQAEAGALIALAQSLAHARSELGPTAQDVEALVEAAARQPTPIKVERGFEQAARRLRAGWLRAVAAETAGVLRSPTESEVERLERGRHDAYGYERDFRPESLEARCSAFFEAPPAGWSVAHVLFSSGQAALATILLGLAEPRPGKLRVAHVGAYFETRELATRACTRVDPPAQADCIILEPVACDGRFDTHEPVSIARGMIGRQALVVDETLISPRTRIPAILSASAGLGVIFRLVSGLKLLQQGLEFANVGIVSVFARDGGSDASIAASLRRFRTLTGAGLRFVDALALEAPFFLDRVATQKYAESVFSNNGSLAKAVIAQNRVFKPLGETDGSAPYGAFELAEGNSAARLEALAGRIEAEAESRGLLIARGGSFGFRGHRYEVIEPEGGEPPFLRIALGARHDHSCAGLIELVAQFAAGGIPTGAEAL